MAQSSLNVALRFQQDNHARPTLAPVYRMHVRHELLTTDLPRRLRFAEWFNQRCRLENLLTSLIIGDEAAFSMNADLQIY